MNIGRHSLFILTMKLFSGSPEPEIFCFLELHSLLNHHTESIYQGGFAINKMEYSETYLHRYAGCSCRRPHVPGILRSHDAALLQDRLQRRAVHYCPVPHGTCFCRLGYGSQRPHPDPVRLFLQCIYYPSPVAAAMRLPLNQVITMVAAVNPAISALPTFIFMATSTY